MLLSNGIATRDLLECLWDNTETDFLLDLMHSLFLLSSWGFGGHRSAYLVPSMVRATGNQVQLDAADFVLEFTYLPPGVFERLVCLSVEYGSMHLSQDAANATEPQLYKDLCSMEIKSGLNVTMQREKNRILVCCQPSSRRNDMSFIVLSMLRKVKSTIPGDSFKWTVQQCKDGQLVPFQAPKMERVASDIDVDGFFKTF